MKLSFWIGTFLAAWAGSVIGLVLILPLGLIAAEWVIFPMSLSIAALLAGLSAGWVGTWLAKDQTHTRLLPVIGATEIMAFSIAVIFLSSAALRTTFLGPWIVIGGVCSLLLALTASGAAWRLRGPIQNAGNEFRLTLVLLGLALLLVPIIIGSAALLGLTGA